LLLQSLALFCSSRHLAQPFFPPGALPPLPQGGVKAFLSCLRQHAPLARSADDPNTYLVNDTADPLQRSL
jgi:hypothetical protein